MPDVNIPLLRKAVEWAEAEAAKPAELCEWEQNYFEIDPNAVTRGVLYRVQADGTQFEVEKSADCGTCYCIAGYAAALTDRVSSSIGGQEALGLADDDAGRLFHEANTIEDVRRIAEEIAGERL